MALRASGADPISEQDQPGSFKTGVCLMQDAVQSGLVSQGYGAGRTALFANWFKEGREEALVINADSELTYLERSSSSETGWLQTPVAAGDGSPITAAEVVAAVHPDGTVWAFCTVPAALGHAEYLTTLRLARSGGGGEAGCTWIPDSGAFG